MGFIDYHGTKEDRYEDVVEYARARQEEDWKLKEEQRISLWLRDLTGKRSLIKLTVPELLKKIIIEYRALQRCKIDLYLMIGTDKKINQEQLWKDFSVDLAVRHLSLFHLTEEQRETFLRSFQNKIFKLSEPLPPEEHYRLMAENREYNRYFIECFDPTWKGLQFFKWLHAKTKKKDDYPIYLDEFLTCYNQLCLLMSLYLYQLLQPRDSSWMMGTESEIKAVDEIRRKILRGMILGPDYSMLINPLYRAEREGKKDLVKKDSDAAKSQVVEEAENGIKEETSNVPGEMVITEPESSVPDSGLDKKQFKTLLEQGGLNNFSAAAKLLLECGMPDDIEGYYRQLIERIPVLQNAIDQFDDIYSADLDQFNEYYAPEALKLTAVYLDYQAAKPSDKILKETKDAVALAVRKLVQVVNEKIDEIYRFVTIDAKAEAKALETLMSQDGYVNPEHRIR